MCHCSIERRCNTTLLIVFSIVCVTRISANLVTYQPGLVTMGVSLSQTVVTRHRVCRGLGSPCNAMSNPAQSYQRANSQPVPLVRVRVVQQLISVSSGVNDPS